MKTNAELLLKIRKQMEQRGGNERKERKEEEPCQ